MKYRFEKYLTGDQIEALNAEIDSKNPKELILQVMDFEDARLFANSRLMGFLLKCRQKEISIIIDTAQYSENFFAKIRNKKLFLNSTTGILLSAFATKIIDEKGIDYKELVEQEQLKELAKTISEIEFDGKITIKKKERGVIESGKEKTAFFFDGFNRPEKAAIFKNAEFPDKVRDFNSDFSSMLRELGLDIRRFYSKIEFISSNIGFEVVQNINDHALNNLKGVPINQLQFVHFHRINVNAYRSKLEYILEEQETPITDYLKTIRCKFNLDSNSSTEAHIYEISISDSGVGIPGRLARTMDVYTGDIKTEKNFLINALHETVSSKLRKTGDIGYGLPKIMEAVKNTDGLIVFRTGRLLMFKHFLDKENLQTDNLSDWDSTTRNYLSGTSISILFPVVTNNNATQTKIF